MSEENSVQAEDQRDEDSSVDAIAAICLVFVAVAAMVYWVSGL